MILYLIFLFGFIFNKGSFSYPGVYILLVALILMSWQIFKKARLTFEPLNPAGLLCLLNVLSLLVYGGFYQTKFVNLSYLLLVVSTLTSFGLILTNQKRLVQYGAGLLLAIALLLRLLMIAGSPNPHIDVFDFLKFGAIDLLNGHNPYSSLFHTIYPGVIPNYYPYPPVTLLLTIPAVALLNDPRYAMVIAELAISLIIFRLVKSAPQKYLWPLIFLYHPLSLVLLEQSFTEPLVLMLLLLTFERFKNHHWRSGAIAFSLSLATKQYLWLLLPIYFNFLSSISKKYLVLISMLTAALVTAPFVLWNPADFWQDVVLYNLSLPARPYSLTFTSLLSQSGLNFNYFLVTVIMVAAVIAYCQRRLSVSRFLYLSAWLLFVFFFFNKWSALNYYYLIGQLFLIGVISQTDEQA